jgi:hypothetical protein
MTNNTMLNPMEIHQLYYNGNYQPTNDQRLAHYYIMTRAHTMIGGASLLCAEGQDALRLHEKARLHLSNGALLGPNVLGSSILNGVGIYAPIAPQAQLDIRSKRQLAGWFSHDMPGLDTITALYFRDLALSEQRQNILARRLLSNHGLYLDYQPIDTRPTPYTSAWDNGLWQAARCGNRWMFRFSHPHTDEVRHYLELPNAQAST